MVVPKPSIFLLAVIELLSVIRLGWANEALVTSPPPLPTLKQTQQSRSATAQGDFVGYLRDESSCKYLSCIGTAAMAPL